PVLIDVNSDAWSGTTLPSMAIGYSTRFSPLQILTLYNAVANKGKMVKPLLVKEISDKGKLIKRFSTEVLEEEICSESTIEKVHEMLVGVVENGTAQILKSAEFKIAGKTGTAKVADKDKGYGKRIYRASFAGYFPADNPKYSCIVVVSEPTRFDYYGASVAGPIFKEIANKIFSRSMELHEELADMESKANSRVPYSKHGYKKDLVKVFEGIGVETEISESASDWVVSSTNQESVSLQNRKIISNLVPNVIGMGLRDAIYLLENSGLNVITEGRGVVKEQSITPGQASRGNQKIYLKLS
ncbi:MAG: PASTA domain-containing protein, partial [Flavobacteriales bacterium]|nr:PASTA domain-containing protein [Flavobacteriales bacterium]